MNVEDLRERLELIAKEEYLKICNKYPVSVHNQGETIGSDISVACVLKTDKIGLSFYHGCNGSGYNFCELVYTVHKNTFQISDRYYFYTQKEAEIFLNKSKSKVFKNPFNCCITKEYNSYDNVKDISDITFKGLTLEDLEIQKTIVIKL